MGGRNKPSISLVFDKGAFPMKNSAASESKVAGLFEDLRLEIEKATGGKSGRARFYGFQLVEGIKTLIAEALNFFREGQWNNAEVRIHDAKKWIVGNQRAFARNSVIDSDVKTSFFTRMIVSLPHLDRDIEEGIERKRSAFREFVSQHDFDLDEASELSWALRDAILRAESEQEARNRNRELRKLKGIVRRKDARIDRSAEQAREAQLRHDAEQANRRSELADKFAQELQLL